MVFTAALWVVTWRLARRQGELSEGLASFPASPFLRISCDFVEAVLCLTLWRVVTEDVLVKTAVTRTSVARERAAGK